MRDEQEQAIAQPSRGGVVFAQLGRPVGGPGARKIGRPSKAAPYRALVAELLARDPDIQSLEILRQVREHGYRGGKSALYALAATVRAEARGPLSTAEDRPGAVSQHDFAGVNLRMHDGTIRRAAFLVSRLSFSSWVEATLLPDDGIEALVGALYDHFAALGGVPLLAAFNHARLVVLRSDREGRPVEWHPALSGALLELGVGVDLCDPRRRGRRGESWDLCAWLKSEFFRPRAFADRASVHCELASWLEGINARGVAARIAEDRARLRPLRVAPAR